MDDREGGIEGEEESPPEDPGLLGFLRGFDARLYPDGGRSASVFSRSAARANLVDGKRSLLDIWDLVSFEFKETSVKYVLHLAEDLRERGLIEYY